MAVAADMMVGPGGTATAGRTSTFCLSIDVLGERGGHLQAEE